MKDELKTCLDVWRRCELVIAMVLVPQEKFPCRAGAAFERVFVLYC